MARAASPVIVGRDDELARLRTLLDELREAGPTVVLVAGEAGVGKSRLVDELVRVATERRVRVVRGWCVEFGEAIWPLAPVRDMLTTLVDQLDGDALELVLGRSGVQLAQLVPELAPDAGPAEPLSAERLGELVLGVIRRLAQRGPLVLIVEDLHWADTSTRQLVATLAHAGLTGPVLVVTTYRVDDVHYHHPLRPVLAELARSSRTQRIELAPLDRDAVAAMIAAITGEPPDRDHLVEIHRRSGGNPFFVEELLAMPGDGSSGTTASLRDVLLARASRLGDRALDLLRLVAVAGSTTPEVLEAAAATPPGGLDEALDELVATGLVVHHDGEVRFRHDLARETFLLEERHGRRAELHRRLAAALEAVGSDRTGELARHWSAAGDQPRAYTASVAAAHEALRIGAPAEAYDHVRRALDVLPNLAQGSSPTERGALASLAAIAAERAGRVEQALEHGLDAIDAFSGVDPLAEARAWLQLRDPLRIACRWDDVTCAVDRALELLPSSPPSAERSHALALRAFQMWRVGRIGDALECARSALELARAVGDADAEAHALVELGIALLDDDVEAGIAELEQAVATCDDAVSHRRRALAVDALMAAYTYVHRFDDALAVAELVPLDDTSRRSADYGDAIIADRRLLALERLGRWDEVERVARELIGTLDHRALETGLARTWGLVLVRQGRVDEAGPIMRRAHVVLRDGTWDDDVAELGVAVVEEQVATGRHAETEELVDELLDRLIGTHVWGLARLVAVGVASLADRVELERAGGGPDGRVRLAGLAASWIDAVARVTSRTDRGGRLDLERALAELGRLRGVDDASRWTSIADASAALGLRYDEAYARWRAAGAALSGTAGRSAAARRTAATSLEAARAIAVSLPAAALVERIDELAVHAGLHPHQSERRAVGVGLRSVADGFSLTVREREVLALLAQGSTNGEIAAALSISTKTASVHVSNLLRKLGVTNRVEAAALVR